MQNSTKWIEIVAKKLHSCFFLPFDVKKAVQWHILDLAKTQTNYICSNRHSLIRIVLSVQNNQRLWESLTWPWVSPGGFPGSNRTASPKSPIIAVKSSRSRTFLLLKSLEEFEGELHFGLWKIRASQSVLTVKPNLWTPLPVCNGGFGTLPLVVGDVLVEVGQTSGHGLCYMTQLAPGHSVTLQVVCQWALREEKHIKDQNPDQPADWPFH